MSKLETKINFYGRNYVVILDKETAKIADMNKIRKEMSDYIPSRHVQEFRNISGISFNVVAQNGKLYITNYHRSVSILLEEMESIEVRRSKSLLTKLKNLIFNVNDDDDFPKMRIA